MLGLLVWGFWLALGLYSLWFFFKADTLQSLSLDDLALTWRMHKLEMGCKASRIHSLIAKNNEVVGFRCDCGYEFLQKRLITQKTHTYPQNRTYFLTSSRKSPLPKTRQSL
jgi:transposase-like protein